MENIDIISVGEILIDFIGHEINTSINRTKDYHRYLGGSPTNVAVNASRLGLKSLLVGTCGEDGLGEFAVRKLKGNHVDVSCVRKHMSRPTSVIFVSKSSHTPEFIPYREADCEIIKTQLPEGILSKSQFFHTTCFALSKNPARNTILEWSKKAKDLGLKLSIDINFSEKVWPNKEEAKHVLKEYLYNNPLVKLSEDDCYRLFTEAKSEDYIFEYFHKLGVKTVCLTKGHKGVVVSDIDKGLFFQEALKIDGIKDTTGAGDAFWTGFLFAQIKNKSLEDSITIAQKLAMVKLQNVGRLPDKIDIANIIEV